jgi:hypothetical protein
MALSQPQGGGVDTLAVNERVVDGGTRRTRADRDIAASATGRYSPLRTFGVSAVDTLPVF